MRYLFFLFLPFIACQRQNATEQQQQPIAIYWNEWELQHDSTSETVFIQKGDSFELNPKSYQDLDSLSSDYLCLNYNSWGTSYLGAEYLHCFLLDATPTLLFIKKTYGSNRITNEMLYDMAEDVLRERMEKSGKDWDDLPESEQIDRMSDMLENHMDELFPEPAHKPWVSWEEEDRAMEIWVAQKQTGKWVDITKTAIPADFAANLAGFYPFAQAEYLENIYTFTPYYYSVASHFPDVNYRHYWPALCDIYGFKDSLSENKIPLWDAHLNAQKELIFNFSADYSFGLKWQNNRFEWGQKPSRTIRFQERENPVGLSVKKPEKTVIGDGKINNQTDFHVKFDLEYSIVTQSNEPFKIDVKRGKYWYNNPQDSMLVKGNINPEKELHLWRYHYNKDTYTDHLIEYFNGKFVSPTRIEGTWEHLDKKIKQPFYLELK